MALGEFVLSYLRHDFPKKEKTKSNKKTLKAMKETREGKGS